jgi:hypothetical protein
MVEKNAGEMHPPPPPSTPRIAPWDAVQELCNRLDRLLNVLEGWVFPGGSGYEALPCLWQAGPKQEILAPAAIRVPGVTVSEMADFHKGKRLILKITSTLDQNAVVQVVGNIDKTIDGAGNVGPAVPCAANANAYIGLGWAQWHPYIGVTITLAAVPTTGSIKVEAVVQE